MNKIELLKALIEKETDEEKLVSLQDELVQAIKDEAKAEARAEFEVENKGPSELAPKEGEGEPPRAPVRVTESGIYKGYNLKRNVDWFQTESKRLNLQARAKQRPEQNEKLMKLFADLLERGMASPMQGRQIEKALQVGDNAEGGYLVPEEQRMELVSYIRDVSIALQECQMIPMNHSVLTLPRELTKVTTTYGAEEEDAGESEPSFDQVTLTARRMGAFGTTSNELLQDSAVPILAMLLDQFTEAIGQKVDSTVFIGTGADSAVFSGVFLSTGVSEVFNSGSTAFSELLEANVRNIVSKIRPNWRGNAKWYASASVLWQYIRGLKDSQGGYMFNETRQGQAAPSTLWGYPVREGNDDIMPSTSAADTGMAVFGNLRGLFIGERMTNISLFIDPYVLAKSYQTRYFMFTRWGYAHALPNMYGRIVTAAS